MGSWVVTVRCVGVYASCSDSSESAFLVRGCGSLCECVCFLLDSSESSFVVRGCGSLCECVCIWFRFLRILSRMKIDLILCQQYAGCQRVLAGQELYHVG